MATESDSHEPVEVSNVPSIALLGFLWMISISFQVVSSESQDLSCRPPSPHLLGHVLTLSPPSQINYPEWKKIYPVSISWTPLCESISNFFYYIGLMISLLLLLSFLSVFNLKFIYYLFMLSFLPLCWSAYLKVYPAKSWVQPFSMVSVMADLYCQLDWVWNQLEDNIWDVYRVYLGMTKWAGSTLPHKSWHLLVVVTV